MLLGGSFLYYYYSLSFRVKTYVLSIVWYLVLTTLYTVPNILIPICLINCSPSLRNNLSAAYFSNFPYLEQFHLSAQNKARYHLANEYTLFFKTELAFHFLKVIFKGQTNNLNLYIWLSAHQSSLKENEALTQQKQPTFL